MRRQISIIPDYLVEGLVTREKEEVEGAKQIEAGPEKLWQTVKVDGSTFIVRSAKKIGEVVKDGRNK